MRKSFTQLISIFILICAFGFTAVAAPGVDILSPLDNATNVNPTTTEFKVTFTENVSFTALGGTFTIMKGAALIKTIPIYSGSPNASISGTVLTVVHGLTLEEGAAYTLGITDNAIVGYDGTMPDGTWNFTIGDYTKPVVGTLNPAKGDANVNVAQPIDLVITFTDANNIAKVDGKKVWLYKADGTIVDIVTISAANTSVAGKVATVTVSDKSYFNEYTGYYVNVEAGAFVDVSTNANAFAGIMDNTTWTFTSRDYSAPSVISKSPSNVAATTATLNVTISEKGFVYYRQGTGGGLPAADGVDGWTKVATDASGVVAINVTGLTNGTAYTYELVAENMEGDQQPAASTLTFTTLDNTPPTIDSKKLLTTNNVTNGVELNFNEKVKKGTGDLLIKLQSNNAIVRTIPASNVTISDKKVTIPFTGLDSEVGYYVIAPDGFITDLAGNGWVSIYNLTTSWQFTSSDFIKPTVTQSIALGTPPAATDNILLTFSEDVALVSGAAFPVAATNTQVEWFPYIALEQNNTALAFTATYAANKITIDPTASLAPNTTYTIVIRPNVIEDAEASGETPDGGNKLSAAELRLNVTTGDFGGVGTIALSPAAAATNVSQNVKPTITFSQGVKDDDGTAIVVGDITAAVTFKVNGGAAVPFTGSWDAASLTYTITPNAALTSEGVYDLDFNHTAVKDVHGQAFADPTPSTAFEVIDYTVPTATFSHTGTVGDKLSTDNLTITLSEPVTIGGVALDNDNVDQLIVFKKVNADGDNLLFDATVSGNVITINPDANLVVDQVYYYGIGAGSVSDAPEGANDIADSFSTFTFAPIAPDVLEVAVGGYAPAIDATGIQVDGSGDLVASLTFAEPVKPNPVTPTPNEARLYIVGTALPVSTVTIDAADFLASTLTITFPAADLGGDLVSLGEYYIQLAANVVVANDDNSNTFAGILDDSWTFIAADTDAPTITLSTPADNATGVAFNAAIKFTSDEKVVKGTGNITITSGNGADNQTIPVANVTIDAAGTTVTIPHTAFDQYNTEYSIVVPAGAFKDVAGNSANAISDPDWTFTTITNDVPGVQTLFPADNADLVDVNTVFTITFDENVQVGPAGTSIFLVQDVDGATTTAVIEADGTLTPNGDLLIGSADVGFSSDVQISGATATINFGVALAENKDYYILVEADAFKDVIEPVAEQESTVEINDGTSWNFTTKDKKVPTFVASYVARGSGMDITSDVVLTFDKPIEKVSGSDITDADVGSLFAMTVDGDAVAFTGTISADKKVVTLSNSSFIPVLTTANSEDVVVVGPKTNSIRGKDNHVTVGTTDNFTISDYVAPTVDVLTINQNTDGSKFKFNLSSSENGDLYWLVQAGSATLTAEVVKATGTKVSQTAATVKVVEKTGLTSETAYTVYAVAVDGDGNLSVVETLPVTTPDVTKPSLVSASDISAAGVVTLTFNDDVVPGAGPALAYIRLADSKQLVGILNVTDAAADKKLEINDANDATALLFEFDSYPDNQQFIIEINPAANGVADESGNLWDGQIGLDANALIVKMADDTAPNAPVIAPGSPVALDAVFTLTYNEDVKLASSYEFLFEYKEGGLWYEFELVEAANISVAGNVVSINPDRTFWPQELDGTNKEFRFSVANGSITDLAGNVAPNIVPVEFTTVDNAAPTVTFVPANGATGISTTVNPTITFSEAITNLDGSVIDAFDLDSLVVFQKGGVDQPFSAEIDGAAKVITVDVGTLSKGMAYTLGIKGSFKDDAGNVVAAQEATFTTTPDPEPSPVYVSFDPDVANVATKTTINVDQSINVIFTGQLYTYTNVVATNNLAVTVDYLKNVFTISPAVAFSVSIEKWASDETIIKITPDADLASQTTYVVTVLDDKLQIGTGNVTPLGDSDWTPETYASNDYITVDVVKPTLQALSPVDGSIAGKSTTIKVDMNEKVKGGTGTIKIYQWNGILAKEVDASTLGESNAAGLLSITSLSDLTTNLEYYVIIPDGAIVDMSGNPWVGITAEDEWTITVQDDVNPVVTAMTPAHEATNVAITADLTIQFDRPVALGTDGFVALYDANGIAIDLVRISDGSAKIAISGSMATIDIAGLAEDKVYYAEVAAGTFVSAADNTKENAGIVRTDWMFTTETNDIPAVLILDPDDNAPAVALDAMATITFDIDVQAGSGVIELHKNDGVTIVHSYDVNSEEVMFSGSTVSFDMEGMLDDNTEYYIIVPNGAITNISSTPEAFPGLVQTTSWSFTTLVDEDAPTAVVAPVGADQVAAEVVLTMDFSEKVVKGMGNITLYNAADDSQVEVFDVATAVLSDDTLLTIMPTAILDNSSYYVMVDAGVVKDLASNDFAGIADKTTWAFQTVDETAPVLMTKTPNAETIEANHPTLVMTFDEPVALSDAGGSLMITRKDLTDAEVTVAITAAMISADGMTVTVDYVSPTDGGLDKNADYFVTVDAGTLEDMAGNAWEGVTDATAWTFKTGANFATDNDDLVSGSLEFKVYPNPFDGYVTVDNADQLSRIVITNVAGQRVKDIVSPERIIRTGDLRSGIYFITLVKDGEAVKTDRIVKR